MGRIERGEVWLVDLGLAAKVRPCLVLSVSPEGIERVVATLVPHTTSVRGTRFEAVVNKSFLKQGAFDAQGLVTVPIPHLIKRLGTLNDQDMGLIENVVSRRLKLKR